MVVRGPQKSYWNDTFGVDKLMESTEILELTMPRRPSLPA